MRSVQVEPERPAAIQRRTFCARSNINCAVFILLISCTPASNKVLTDFIHAHKSTTVAAEAAKMWHMKEGWVGGGRGGGRYF